MTFTELLAWSVWDDTRPRKILTLVVLALVGPFFALLLKQAGGGGYGAGYSLVMQTAVYSLSMVLLCIVFATSAIAGEVTGRTISYILTRPVSRVKVLLAKWLAASIVVSLAVIASCLLVALAFGFSQVGPSRVFRDMLVLCVGVLTYNAIFVALSVLLTRPVLPAVFYTFLFETWVWAIPGDFPKLSVMSYLRALSEHEPVAGAPKGIMDLLAQMNPETITKVQAWNTLAFLVIFSLAVGCIVFAKGEYVPKEEST